MALWISEDGKLAEHKCFKCGSNDEYKDAVPRLAALERVAEAAQSVLDALQWVGNKTLTDLHQALAELYRPSDPGEKK